MPWYTYKCPKCSYQKDVKHDMNESPIVACTHCSGTVTTVGRAMEKCLSVPALHFKGSGFYATDYKNK